MTTHTTSSTDASHGASTGSDHGAAGSTHSDAPPPAPMTRAEVRQCLGFEDDHAPRWVKAIHEYKISTFGSGNGQAVR